MSRRKHRSHSGLGTGIAISAALHLVFFFAVVMMPGVRPAPVDKVWYVDVADLPAAVPGPAEKASAPEPAAPAAPVPPAPSPQPVIDARKSPPPAPQAQKAPQAASTETEAESFRKRMEELQRQQEARDYARTMENLRKKSSEQPASAPAPARQNPTVAAGGGGGSDYLAYIHSRLQDAFEQTLAYQGKNPEVRIMLTIDRFGNLTEQRIVQSSGDRMFEDAVLRAVTLAKPAFRPPPDGKSFSKGFVFKPKGVESK